MDLSSVDSIVEHHGADPTLLLAILQDVQDALGWLPREAADRVALSLQVPIARIYAMATFYQAFHLAPRGRHVFTVCMGTACHVRGAARLVDTLARDLRVRPGETTKDLAFTLEEVNCVGACALGPLVIVDGAYKGNMTSAKLSRVVRTLRKADGDA